MMAQNVQLLVKWSKFVIIVGNVPHFSSPSNLWQGRFKKRETKIM
jgi:hypothetical protein